LIAHYMTSDGESSWFEGLQLLATYVILAIAFAFA
jgi:Ca2+:H+ antiporter